MLARAAAASGGEKASRIREASARPEVGYRGRKMDEGGRFFTGWGRPQIMTVFVAVVMFQQTHREPSSLIFLSVVFFSCFWGGPSRHVWRNNGRAEMKQNILDFTCATTTTGVSNNVVGLRQEKVAPLIKFARQHQSLHSGAIGK